ncbi:MAG: hypothetical protein JWN16_816 [Alphaproteobacteria bacterium]|nr:hypothetical protein [Alphaproteobacteria bacterium]
MKTQTILPPVDQDPTEALLQGLIAECQAIIREAVLPGLRETTDPYHRRLYIQSVTNMVDGATRLSDAIGRLRGTAPAPEFRQRITVEKIQRLSPPEGEGG